MASMVILAVLMTFLFGGMMLALVMGYVETEKARQAEAPQPAEAAARAVEEMPRFFGVPEQPTRPVAAPTDGDGFVDRLEGFLRAEHALVAHFVNEPSVDNLYRQPTLSLSIN